MNKNSEKRRILLGISGSIAAYKSVELARLLITEGFEVRVVMTESATEFITPLTLQSVTGHPVTTGFWNEAEAGIGHIELADWAEAIVIAPATADLIAKMNYGFADSALLAIILATKAPILVAPAMNVNMFEHPKTKQNIESLQERGLLFVEPEVGALACGWNGTGRLAAPSVIMHHIRRLVTPQDYKGKRIVITTGSTREAIDPVRFISNRSSGKMGVALACEAFRRGADVTVVHGVLSVEIPSVISQIPIVTALDLQAAIQGLKADIIIMAAAVADYRPREAASQKIKREGEPPEIELVENPDILAEVGQSRKGGRAPILVGFAVETGDAEQLVAEVRRKLQAKQVDMMVGNRAQDSFDRDTNQVWIVDRNGRQEEVATSSKSRVAAKIFDALLKL